MFCRCITSKTTGFNIAYFQWNFKHFIFLFLRGYKKRSAPSFFMDADPVVKSVFLIYCFTLRFVKIAMSIFVFARRFFNLKHVRHLKSPFILLCSIWISFSMLKMPDITCSSHTCMETDYTYNTAFCCKVFALIQPLPWLNWVFWCMGKNFPL